MKKSGCDIKWIFQVPTLEHKININMSLLTRKLQKVILNSARTISKLKKRKILQDESTFEGMSSNN